MEDSRQNVLVGKNKVKTSDKLLFETVLIVDGGFEVINPQSSSSSEIDFLRNSNVSNLTNQILNESDRCLVIKKDLNVTEQYSSKTLSDASPLGIDLQELVKNGSDVQSHKDSIFKSKIRALRCHQKSENLKKSFSRITKTNRGVKNLDSNAITINNSAVVKCNGIDLPASSSEGNAQVKYQSSEIIKPHSRKENPNKIPSQQFNDNYKELNVDGLKSCIIEASRSLIKAEKSFRILGKLIHTDVLVEKRSAIKHLKNFQYTINTCKKAITGINQTLSTHYTHLTPQISNEFSCNSDSSKHNLDSGSKENIIDYESLLNSNKKFEIIIPAVNGKEVCDRSDDLTYNQKNHLTDQPACPELLSVHRKRTTEISKCDNFTNPKKVKINILHRNWTSGLIEKSAERKHFHNENSIQSKINQPQEIVSCEPIIILD